MSNKLGELTDYTAQRDAVHVAIAPITAPEKIFPGQKVDANGRPGRQSVGIVDPFLNTPVLPGQQCYIILFPNTVTDLRHEWKHPAFDEEENNGGYGECSNC